MRSQTPNANFIPLNVIDISGTYVWDSYADAGGSCKCHALLAPIDGYRLHLLTTIQSAISQVSFFFLPFACECETRSSGQDVTSCSERREEEKA